jgi:hypothetical protein
LRLFLPFAVVTASNRHGNSMFKINNSVHHTLHCLAPCLVRALRSL